jgi:predicted signal transduction protein with EAL and GGDEF domain
MQGHEKTTHLAAEGQHRSALGRVHIIDVECAPDLGVIVRVLNLLAVARADVSSIGSHVEGECMRLRVNARGMSASQGDTFKGRVEAMEGVSSVRVASSK